MSKYSFALSDELCKQYYLFKQHAAGYDKGVVSRLLSYYNEEYITNTAQLTRVEADVSQTLMDALRHNRLSNQSVEELAAKTMYKLILCTNQSGFPYVNINSDPICNCVIGSFYRDVPREKAISHLNALCKDGKRIHLYDQYLSGSIEVLPQILPDKAIELIYATNRPTAHLGAADIAYLSGRNAKWTFTPDDTMFTHHDRYIIIDDKLEIVLTSGFEYLANPMKEISYIVRPVQVNRLIQR